MFILPALSGIRINLGFKYNFTFDMRCLVLCIFDNVYFIFYISIYDCNVFIVFPSFHSSVRWEENSL